ncbi:MAG: hypothetical protein P4M08_08250 [Oligoflexia bacterium]|nr:hypothetical protein [Oligoflexia bacterium]
MTKSIFKSILKVLIFSVPILGAHSALAGDTTVQSELGYETFYRASDEMFSMNRPYLIQKLEMPVPNTTNPWLPEAFEGEYRAWGNFSFPQSNSGEKGAFDLRTLKLRWSGESWKLSVGLQDIVWGETFGDRVVDVVNPRDYSDYVLTDLSWAILPVWAVSAQKLFDPFSLQLVYVPLTVHDKLPVQVAGVPIIDNSPDPRAFRDNEYGARAGVLLPEGTDLKAYYYHHFNRIPVVEALILPSQQMAFAVNAPQMIETYGLSATHALGSFVLRADIAYNENEFITAVDYGTPFHGNPLHGVLGTDWTADDQTTLGWQLHYDSDPRDASPLFWGSVQCHLQLLDGKLVPEALIYKGLNNRDLWANPGLTAHVGAHWLLHAQGDYILGRQGSLLQLYQQENRVLGRVSYLF